MLAFLATRHRRLAPGLHRYSLEQRRIADRLIAAVLPLAARFDHQHGARGRRTGERTCRWLWHPRVALGTSDDREPGVVVDRVAVK